MYLCLTALSRHNLCSIKFACFESTISKCKELCDYHHNLIVERFHNPKKKLHVHL